MCLLVFQMMSLAQLKVSQDGVRAELSSGGTSENNGCMLINTNNYTVEVDYDITFIKKSDTNSQELRKFKTIILKPSGTHRGNGATDKFWISAKGGLPVDFKEMILIEQDNQWHRQQKDINVRLKKH